MSINHWTDRKSTPSQTVDEILFTAGSTLIINASPEHTFSVITGFSKWGKWNTQTPSLRFEKSDSDVDVGDRGILETILTWENRTLDAPIHVKEMTRTGNVLRFAWRSEVYPFDKLCAERVHVITPVQGREDEACELNHWQSMGGPVAVELQEYGIPAQLRAMNEKYGSELKEYTEKTR